MIDVFRDNKQFKISFFRL